MYFIGFIFLLGLLMPIMVFFWRLGFLNRSCEDKSCEEKSNNYSSNEEVPVYKQEQIKNKDFAKEKDVSNVKSKKSQQFAEDVVPSPTSGKEAIDVLIGYLTPDDADVVSAEGIEEELDAAFERDLIFEELNY